MIESDEVFDGLLRGMATQTSQKMDISVIKDVSTCSMIVPQLLLQIVLQYIIGS